MNKLKNTKVTLKVNKSFFKTKKNSKLSKAAKVVMKTVDEHFKKDKWDLDSGFLVEDVFYEAYGEHLSNYFFKELFSDPKKGYYIASSNRHGGLVVRKDDNFSKQKRGKNVKKQKNK